MVNVTKHGIVLAPRGLEFERAGVLNPAAAAGDGFTNLLYRAVAPGNRSSIGYARIRGTEVVERLDHPLLVPEQSYEAHGMEDPRLVLLEGVYHLFYTAYDGRNAMTAHATSSDLVSFTRHGLVTPAITYDEAEDIFKATGVLGKYQWYERHYRDVIGPDVLLWEKDVFCFPRKIGGRYAMLHRIMPGMQVIYFDSFDDLTVDYWKSYLARFSEFCVLEPELWFETRKLGGGCPPIETPDGWLLIYHAAEDHPTGRIYRAGAALLDLDDPTVVRGRLPEPLFGPDQPWEMTGTVRNVVFPTGAVLEGDQLSIYYGAADTVVGLATLSLAELLAALKANPPAVPDYRAG